MRPSRSARRVLRATGGALALVLALGAITGPAAAALPRPVGRAFLDAGIPLNAVALVVQDLADTRPVFAHQPERPYNPASVMKLVTTFAALELLGPDYRWKTFAYLDGPLDAGVLRGNLVLKGGGDPQDHARALEGIHGLAARRGTRRRRGRPRARPLAVHARRPRRERVRRRAAEALQRRARRAARQFQGGEARLRADAPNGAPTLTVEPVLPTVGIGAPPKPAGGDCGDWRSDDRATFVDSGRTRRVGLWRPLSGLPARTRLVVVAALITRPRARNTSTTYFRAAGGGSGPLEGGVAPAGAPRSRRSNRAPLLGHRPRHQQALEQRHGAAAVPDARHRARAAARDHRARRRKPSLAWLAQRKLRMPELVLDNGSGLSRRERYQRRSLARLLVRPTRSAVREEFKLARGGRDGRHRERRFRNGSVAGQPCSRPGR